jgi:dihydropyrimidinase
MTPPDYVRVTSAAAAQAFNVYPRKGRVAPGSDADVIVLDPSHEHAISARAHHSHMDTNVYEGARALLRYALRVLCSPPALRFWLVCSLHAAPTCCTAARRTRHAPPRMHAGKRIRGRVVVTVSRGRVVWEGGRLSVYPGTSRFVELPTGGPLFEGAAARDAAAWRVPYGPTPVARGGGKEAAAGGGGGERGGGRGDEEEAEDAMRQEL